jgi:hypothetical protein
MKKIAILQSNYIPWKGYFDLIASVDEFIFLDDVQYTKNDWRNRNLIKTPNGVEWLTVPVTHEQGTLIRDVQTSGDRWQAKHWEALRRNYRRAKFFDEIAEWLEPFYKVNGVSSLSKLNQELVRNICNYLDLDTHLIDSSNFELKNEPTERLVEICKQAKATDYISGPAAKDYLDEKLFNAAGMTVSWFAYDGYEAYPQLWGDFIHQVTILDLLFNCGKQSINYMQASK